MPQPNENSAYAISFKLVKGLQRLQSTHPNLPLVPLNGNKQPLGDAWQNHPLSADELITGIEGGGVEVKIKDRIKKIQPLGFGLITGRPFDKDGKAYYLMALDQDGASAEAKILSLSNNELLPKTVAFTSGRTGRCQYLFLVPEEFKDTIRTRKVKTEIKGEQVEFRWSNLQSVLPPSVHPTTGEYRWVTGCAIDQTPIAIAPSWVIKQMSLEKERQIQPQPQQVQNPSPASISPTLPSSLLPAQLPRHPEQIKIPVPEAVPLEICCRKEVRDWIENGVEKGFGRNDTAISVGLELVAVERHLSYLGQPTLSDARQLFSEYCQHSNMTQKEEEERWKWCASSNPTPSCSPEAIDACIQGWYWRERIKPVRISRSSIAEGQSSVQGANSAGVPMTQSEKTHSGNLKSFLKLKENNPDFWEPSTIAATPQTIETSFFDPSERVNISSIKNQSSPNKERSPVENFKPTNDFNGTNRSVKSDSVVDPNSSDISQEREMSLESVIPENKVASSNSVSVPSSYSPATTPFHRLLLEVNNRSFFGNADKVTENLSAQIPQTLQVRSDANSVDTLLPQDKTVTLNIKEASPPISPFQPKHKSFQSIKTPMIPDKIEAKQVGQEMQELPYQSSLLVAQIAKKILQKIKLDTRLREDFQVALDKPATISINVDGKLAYQEIEGNQPSVNEISKTELDYVAKALSLKEGQSLEEPRNVTIAINGKDVFRVEQGKVELNKFSPQRAQEKSQSPQQHNLTAEGSQPQAPPLNGGERLTQEEKPQAITTLSDNQKTVDRTSPVVSNDLSQRPDRLKQEVGYRVITESPATPVTTLSPVETHNKLKVNSSQQAFQSFNQSFLESKVEPQLAQNAAFIMAFVDPVRERTATEQDTIKQVHQHLVNNSQVQSHQPKVAEPENQKSSVRFSPDDRAALEQQGLDPNAIESKVNLSLTERAATIRSASYTPVVIVAEQQEKKISVPNQSQQRSKFSSVVAAIKSAPVQIVASVKSGLGRIQQAIAGTSQKAFSSLGQLQSPMKGREQRRQDLNNLAALSTAKEALNHLGANREDGVKVFKGTSYQFYQKDNNIVVSSSQRGPILSYNASTGTLKGNLNRQDVETFKAFDSALGNERHRSNNIERQSSHQTSKKEQMEIG